MDSFDMNIQVEELFDDYEEYLNILTEMANTANE